MLDAMFTVLQDRIAGWLFQTHGPEAGDVLLHRRRVFILPTRSGLAFAGTLLLLLIGSINYGLSLGFMLTFFVGATGVVGMNYTWRNLAHLTLRPLTADPVFAGEAAEFSFALDNSRRYARYALRITAASEPRSRPRRKGGAAASGAPTELAADVGPQSMLRTAFALRAEHRGWMALPRLRLETTYPLGLWRAWGYWQPPMRCLVYPAPEANPPALPAGAWQAGEDGASGMGQENFSGVREYQVGDSPRHIAWKVVARLEERLATKAFEGGGRRELWLRWQDTPARLGTEARLSRLTAWVLQADAMGLEYGLELPSRREAGARGPAHREACLRALALEPGHD
jgi:uncharacterized protein (DUF58 family)